MTALRDDPGFARVIAHLSRRGGGAFELYKDLCLARRLAIRMRARDAGTVSHYASLLDQEPEEIDRLFQAITVQVSGFFRNPAAWRRLRAAAQALASSWTTPLLGWSAGCATGEEAYSLAMLLDRTAGEGREWWVDATDIDAGALSVARGARYSADAEAVVLAEAGSEYGSLKDDRFEVAPRVRSAVRFHQGDLLDGPPGGLRYHLVVCRNVLIYFADLGQRRILEVLTRALLPGGLLMLGKAELSLSGLPHGLDVVDARERIYRRAR